MASMKCRQERSAPGSDLRGRRDENGADKILAVVAHAELLINVLQDC